MGGRPGSSTDGPSAQGGWPLNTILPGMDVHPAGSLGSRHHPERLQTRVHFIPSNYPHSKTHTVPSRLGGEGQGALGRGEGTSRQGGDHSYRASLLTRILGNILSSSEEIRGVATDTKSETSQCIHQTETFSNGHAGLHSQVSSQEQMGRVLGPQGCLPPRTDSSFGLQVAEVPDSGSILQLDLPSIRSFYISKSIHHGSQGDCILPPAERSQCVHVPRRLANLRGFSSRSIPPLSVSNRDCSTSRIHHQLREISLDSYPGHSLPGSQDPLRPRTSNTFSRPHQSSQVSGQLLPPQNPINSSGVAEVIRLDGQHGRHCPILPPSHEIDPTPLCQILPTQCTPAIQDGPSLTRSETSPLLVDKGSQSDLRSSFSSSPSRIGPHNRRFQDRLGRSPSGPQDSRAVERLRDQISHQCPRTVSSRTFATQFPEVGEGQGHSSSVRQLNDGGLHKQTRRNPLSFSVYPHHSSDQLVQRQSYFPDSDSHSRSYKYPGRRLVKRKNIEHRVDPQPQHCTSAVPQVVPTVYRPVCLSHKPPTSSVLLSVSRPDGLCNRCPDSGLVRDESVRLSTNSNPPSSHIQDSGVGRRVHSNRSILAPSHLVQTNDRLADGPPSSPTAQPRPTTASGRSNSRTISERSQPSCMAIVRQRCQEKGFSSRSAALIATGRRRSTLNAYSKRLGPYYKWCEGRGVSPTRASIADVADFLVNRFDSGLESSTVRNYKSAILAVHKGFADGSTIDSDGSIRLLLKGMFNSRPPPRRAVSPWDLNIALEFIVKTPFEPMADATLKNITLKTVFLVALASGRRCSELHAISVSASTFTRDKVLLFLRPDFLAKNETRSFSHSSISLPRIGTMSSVAEDRFWCPVRALEYYKRKTASIRGSTDNLFLTHASPYRPASKATIARWISSVIRDSGAADENQSASNAHSVRKVASSWAYHRGVSVADICEAVGWKSQTTFSDIYYRNTCLSSRHTFARAVLNK